MGYMFLLAECFCCHDMFTCNPDLVPSVRDKDGVKRPLCRKCVEWANPIRIEKGLPPGVIRDGAYEPVECD